MRFTRKLTAMFCAIAVTAVLAVSVGAAPADATPGANAVGMSPNGTATISAINYGAEQTAWNFFRSKGLSPVRVAGIIGNLEQESGLNPWIAQYGGGPGRGIAQWSAGGRWNYYYRDNVAWYAWVNREWMWSLQLQLQFVWYELTTFPYFGYAGLQSATSIWAATVVFQNRFEGCGACNTPARVSYAVAAYNRHAWQW